uniref:C-type lectin domain-containing protein n=1 Tax=Acrobeloides nanus TaxID=290746 RepID=A0A914CN63_9BILA
MFLISAFSLFLLRLASSIPISTQFPPPDSSTQPPTPSSCPTGTTPNGNFCYKPVSDPKSWVYAQFDCGSQGGNLASVQNVFDNHFLVDLAKTNFGSPSAFWVGGTSLLNNDSSWSWIDGSKMSYSNWAPGRPRNINLYDSIQVHVPNGYWYDSSRTANLSYICQFPNNNGSNEICEAGWYYVGATNKCYKVLTNNDTFSNQRSNCVSYGGDLVSIHSRLENFAVGSLAISELNQALNTAQTTADFYVGLQYNISYNFWYWVDGTNFTYQPNTMLSNTGYYYGAIDVNVETVNYSWDSYSSGYARPAICENDTFFVKLMKRLRKY